MALSKKILLAVVIVMLAAGIVVFNHQTTNSPVVQNIPTEMPQPTENILPTETPIPTVSQVIKKITVAVPPTITPLIPIIDCVGPDGKHIPNMTQEQCNIFNNAWATNTPTPKP